MNSINPYQSPRSEEPADSTEQRDRPTILRCSLFGLYSGAIFGAICGAAGMMLLGFLLTTPLRLGLVETMVGGAYFGAVTGGFSGAVIGSPLAIAARFCRAKPGLWYWLSAMTLFALVLASCGGWMSDRLVRGVLSITSNGRFYTFADGSTRGEEFVTQMTALGVFIGIPAGIMAGWGFARRAIRFVFGE